MPSTAVEDNDVSADGHDFFDVPTTAVSTSAATPPCLSRISTAPITWRSFKWMPRQLDSR